MDKPIIIHLDSSNLWSLTFRSGSILSIKIYFNTCFIFERKSLEKTAIYRSLDSILNTQTRKSNFITIHFSICGSIVWHQRAVMNSVINLL